MKHKPINRPTLATILAIEACRAGVELTDHGDDVTLTSGDGTLSERLPLADACAVVGMLRGSHCSPHVLKAGRIRIVSP